MCELRLFRDIAIKYNYIIFVAQNFYSGGSINFRFLQHFIDINNRLKEAYNKCFNNSAVLLLFYEAVAPANE